MPYAYLCAYTLYILVFKYIYIYIYLYLYMSNNKYIQLCSSSYDIDVEMNTYILLLTIVLLSTLPNMLRKAWHPKRIHSLQKWWPTNATVMAGVGCPGFPPLCVWRGERCLLWICSCWKAKHIYNIYTHIYICAENMYTYTHIQYIHL